MAIDFAVPAKEESRRFLIGPTFSDYIEFIVLAYFVEIRC